MGRGLAIALAITAWGALALRTWLSMEEGASLLEALWANGRFFTILTNLLVAASFTLVAVVRSPAPRWMTGLMLWIGLVGLVYHAVLAALWEPEGLVLLADVLVHTATPLGTFAYWLFFVRKGGLRWGICGCGWRGPWGIRSTRWRAERWTASIPIRSLMWGRWALLRF